MATELTPEERELTFVFTCQGQAATTKLFPRAAVTKNHKVTQHGRFRTNCLRYSSGGH